MICFDDHQKDNDREEDGKKNKEKSQDGISD